MTTRERRHIAACLREDARRHDRAVEKARASGTAARRIARHVHEATESRRLARVVYR